MSSRNNANFENTESETQMQLLKSSLHNYICFFYKIILEMYKYRSTNSH